MANGRPPQAVIQFPTGDKERLALGLLPLFKPIRGCDLVLADRPKDRPFNFFNPRKTDPADIPATQDFSGEEMGTETFLTICYSEPYTWFSPEVRFPSTHPSCMMLNFRPRNYGIMPIKKDTSFLRSIIYKVSLPNLNSLNTVSRCVFHILHQLPFEAVRCRFSPSRSCVWCIC